MSNLPPGVAELAAELQTLGWVTALFVAGSAATGDYTPGISDLDLVAVTVGPVDHSRAARLSVVHSALDGGAAAGLIWGDWAKAAARPWWWLDPVMIDLGLTSMARGRHELSTGQLLTKTRAIGGRAGPVLADRSAAGSPARRAGNLAAAARRVVRMARRPPNYRQRAKVDSARR